SGAGPRTAPRSCAAPQRAAKDLSLEPGNRIGRRDRLGAEIRAAHVSVAGDAAAVARHRLEPLIIPRIAHVVHQGPGAVECGRAEIALVPGHHLAGRVAYAAADAFDAGVGGLPLRR